MEEIGIVMNGVTGRMGTNQHLISSIWQSGGRRSRVVERGASHSRSPVVGRNERKLRELSEEHDVDRWVADPDLETCLDGDDAIYFDSQVTPRRPESILKAIEAGKDVYCEKPLAMDLDTALEVTRAATKRHQTRDRTGQTWLPGC